MNNFEKWKAELTLDGFTHFVRSSDCFICPAKEVCLKISTPHSSCAGIIRIWGEQDDGNKTMSVLRW